MQTVVLVLPILAGVAALPPATDSLIRRTRDGHLDLFAKLIAPGG